MTAESARGDFSLQQERRGSSSFFSLVPGWLLVVEWLVFFVFLTQRVVPRLASADLQVYVLQPALWLTLGGLSFLLWRQENRGATWAPDKTLLALAALVGLFQVAVFVLAGLLSGFGRSPYASRPSLMALNLWYATSRLAGLELTRWYLLTTLSQRRRAFLGISATWLLFTFVSVPLTSLLELQATESTFRFVGTRLLPSASENLLATYLALVGGPLPAMAYRGVPLAFEWLSPILPNPRWTFTAFLGTLTPIVSLLILRESEAQKDSAPASPFPASRPAGNVPWVLTAVFASFLVWFNMGLFGVRPALISGVSMLPLLRTGDIVITRDVSPSEVRVGDIVRFRYHEDRASIVHRVTEIREEEGRRIFVTKGDNNNALDLPWDESHLEGKAILVIRKVGLASIYLRRLLGSLF
jgi:signal peptidase